MPAPDLTEQVPDEILLKVFDSATLTDLALFSGVSKRWRAVVASHPAYFKHPKLQSTSPSAVAFFTAQITRSRGKPWGICVIVYEPFPAFESAVLPAIASRLDDVEVLTLNVHSSHAQAVFEMLRGTAASLLRLQLYFEANVAVSLPEDILCHAPPGPMLQSLILLNVEIPDTIPPALQAVRRLVFGKRTRGFRTTLHALANAFPTADDITLTDRIISGRIAASDWPDQWRCLPSLVLTFGLHCTRRAVRALPLNQVLHLTTLHTDGTTLLCSSSHLPGALDMCIEHLDATRFSIHLTSRLNRLTRSFYEFITDWTPPRVLPHDIMNIAAIMSRIHSFSIAPGLWMTIVPRMMQCPSITHLTLVLSDPDWLSMCSGAGGHPSTAIFPSLGTLTLAGEIGRVVVTAEDVAQFVLEHLLPQSPLKVRIQGVDCKGYPGTKSGHGAGFRSKGNAPRPTYLSPRRVRGFGSDKYLRYRGTSRLALCCA